MTTNKPRQPLTATSPTQPETFIANNRAELIVYIRQVLGFQPRNSLVLITISGHRMTSVLRVNLPAPEPSAEEAHDYLDDVVATYGQRREDLHLIMLVFGDEPWGHDDSHPPYHQLITAARTLGASAGHRVCVWHAYYVGPEHIDTVFPGDRDTEHIPAAVLKETALNAQLTVAGFCSATSAEAQVRRLVAAPWSNQAELREQLQRRRERKRDHEEGLSFDLKHARYLFGRLEHWDRWLTQIAATGTGSRQDKNAAMIRSHRNDAIELVTDLEHVRTRDLVLVLASFPLMTTVAAAFQHFFSESVQNRLFQSLATNHTEATVPAEAWQITFLSRALMAATDTAPDCRRITGANALLRELLPMATGDSRQAILGLLAWSEWAMGRASLAMVYLDKATAEDPSYRFTMLFNALLSTGRVAEWVTREH